MKWITTDEYSLNLDLIASVRPYKAHAHDDPEAYIQVTHKNGNVSVVKGSYTTFKTKLKSLINYLYK